MGVYTRMLYNYIWNFNIRSQTLLSQYTNPLTSIVDAYGLHTRRPCTGPDMTWRRDVYKLST